MKPTLSLSMVLAAVLSLSGRATPLKVYLLVGQSNMEGHAQTKTFPAMAKDPKSAHLHEKVVGEDGEPRVFDKIPISYAYGDFGGVMGGRKHGKLTAGWGSQHHVGTGKIGPELTFGITMQEHQGEPILLIKSAWGGKSLMVDFRPPSAGPLPDDNKNRDKAGAYYQGMMDHVKDVLADPKKVYPEYNEKEGFEMAGFVWFQGFNDMVGPYPRVGASKGGRNTKDYSEYSRLLACFIRDVRKDLKAPDMPFVIGVLGVGGDAANEGNLAFRKAMAAPARLEEFKGGVAAVETGRFWPSEIDAVQAKRDEAWAPFAKREREAKKLDGDARKKAFDEIRAEKDAAAARVLTQEDLWLLENAVSNQGFHYWGSAKFFALAGEAFAKALIELDR